MIIFTSDLVFRISKASFFICKVYLTLNIKRKYPRKKTVKEFTFVFLLYCKSEPKFCVRQTLQLL